MAINTVIDPPFIYTLSFFPAAAVTDKSDAHSTTPNTSVVLPPVAPPSDNLLNTLGDRVANFRPELFEDEEEALRERELPVDSEDLDAWDP